MEKDSTRLAKLVDLPTELQKLAKELSDWANEPKAGGVLIVTMSLEGDGVVARTLSVLTPEMTFPVFMALANWSQAMVQIEETLETDRDSKHAN